MQPDSEIMQKIIIILYFVIIGIYDPKQILDICVFEQVFDCNRINELMVFVAGAINAQFPHDMHIFLILVGYFLVFLNFSEIAFQLLIPLTLTLNLLINFLDL